MELGLELGLGICPFFVDIFEYCLYVPGGLLLCRSWGVQLTGALFSLCPSLLIRVRYRVINIGCNTSATLLRPLPGLPFPSSSLPISQGLSPPVTPAFLMFMLMLTWGFTLPPVSHNSSMWVDRALLSRCGLNIYIYANTLISLSHAWKKECILVVNVFLTKL